MKRMLIKRYNGVFFALLAAMLCSSMAYGQAKIEMPEGRWVSVGAGLKSSFRSMESGIGTSDYNQSFNLDSLRLYINSELHKDFQVEINTEYSGTTAGEFRVLDAVAKYQPNEYVNIWMGRHITPADRSHMDGPYYHSIFDYAALVSRYPGIFDRDNGVSVSGKLQKGRVKWAFGAYQGLGTSSAGAVGSPFLYAGRVTFNVFDPEPDAGGKSGYYTSSTYYGQKDQVMAFGFAGQAQKVSGLGSGFVGYNADFLYEKKLKDKSVVTLEGAWYNYNIGLATPGSAFLIQAAYLFPLEVGRGKFQPIARYQDFRDSSRLDIGTNYVIRGHSARLSFLYSPTYIGGAWKNRQNNYTGGVQVQF